MNLDYRIDFNDVLPILFALEQLFIELANLQESAELEKFCDIFNETIEIIGVQAENMGFNPKEAIGYFKVKAYLEMSGSYVTITKEEYEKLKFDSERLKDLED